MSNTGSLLLPVQQSMFNLLNSDGSLRAMVQGVFDEVPAGQIFPYVTVGMAIETAHNTLEHMGRDILTTVHVWSQGSGFTESLSIADVIIKLLDNQQITLATGTTWRCQFADAHTMRDPDGITRHVTIAFRVGAQL